jgi:hypothetical protein
LIRSNALKPHPVDQLGSSCLVCSNLSRNLIQRAPVGAEKRDPPESGRDCSDQRHWSEADQSAQRDREQQTSSKGRCLRNKHDLPAPIGGIDQCRDLGFEVSDLVVWLGHPD